MASIIQLRRDTAANWTTINPVLAQAEKGYETDSIGTEEALYKIGDGVTTWNTLNYQVSGVGVLTTDDIENSSTATGSTQTDVNEIFKTTIQNNSISIDNKIEATDYAAFDTGGTLKARLDGSVLYLTNNGTDA